MATKKKKPTKRPKRNKQPDLPAMNGPGVSRPKVPAIEKAAEAYVGVRDQRMELTEREVLLKKELRDLMIKHGLKLYPLDDGKQVVIEPGEDEVKVKKPKTLTA